MSASDPRAELADVARRARRMIERERAGGAGELLAASVAAARRSAPAPARSDTLAAPSPARDSARSDAPVTPDLFSRASAANGPHEHAVVVAPSSAPDSRSLFDEATTTAGGGVLAGGAMGGPLHPRDPGTRAAIDRAARPLLDQIATEVRACQKCALWQGRTQGVPGVGSALSGIVFVGEGPGADEDRLGEPFVGRAGQLLDRIIEAMNRERLIPGVKLDRTTVFIGNIIHCRPPENRVPLANEIEQSAPYLLRQLEALKPRVICCLGKTAAEALLGTRSALGALRGRIYRYHGAKLIVTYHPAACLRNPAYKRPVWEDMQLLAREYLND
ncbi:MAG: uracil-DNA glycosylase [Candidatus Eisenbacteria bacterium]|nr:uracil-DNA glycosylase [Candidatus Eisenbacteria bacterium]